MQTHTGLLLASIILMIAAVPILGDAYAQTTGLLADIIDTAITKTTTYDSDNLPTTQAPGRSTLEITFKGTVPIGGIDNNTFLVNGNNSTASNNCNGTTPTCILTINKALRHDATPTISITSGQNFTSGTAPNQVMYSRGAVTATDGVPPKVIPSMTKITGPNTVVIVYEEAVTATLADYTELRVGRAGFTGVNFSGTAPNVALAPRNIHPTISGSGTDTHVLTFLGAKAETGFNGTIRVNPTAKDLAENTIANTMANLGDGQSPILLSVLVTGPSQVNATWSEPVFKPNPAGDAKANSNPPEAGLFTDIRLSGTSTTPTVTLVSAPTCKPTLSECSYTLTIDVGNTLASLKKSASGVMTISGLVDYDGNSIARVPNVGVGDGQEPIVTRANIKMTGPNQFTITGDEPMRADTATFTDLKVDHDGDSNVTVMCKMVSIKTCADGSKITLPSSTQCQNTCRDNPRPGEPQICDVPDPGTTSSEERCTISSGTNPNATPMQDRNVTGVTRGSDANGLVITFDGEPVKTNTTGDVKIQKTLTDLNDNIAKVEAGTSGDAASIPDDGAIGIISDGQAPQVLSAKVTDVNTVRLDFSEPLQAGDNCTSVNSVKSCTTPQQTADTIFGGNSTSGKQVVQVYGKAGTTTVNGTVSPCMDGRNCPAGQSSPDLPHVINIIFGFLDPNVLSSTNEINDAGDLVKKSDNTVQARLAGLNDSVGLTLAMVNDTNGNSLINQSVTAVPAQAPEIESMLITGPKEITVKFSEPVQKSESGGVLDRENFQEIRIPPGSNIVRSINSTGMSGVVASMNNSTFTLSLRIPNDKPLPTDAVGTMTIRDATDKSLVKRALPASTNLNVGDGRSPLVEVASISGPNKVTIVFTEPVTAKMSDFGEQLGMLTIGTDDMRKIANFAKPGVDTVELTFKGKAVDPDATGMIQILKSVKDTSSKENELGYQSKMNNTSTTCETFFKADRLPSTNSTLRVGNNCKLVDGQKPMLDSIAITGPNTITAKFTEKVQQGSRDGGVADGFLGFRIGEDDYRNTSINIPDGGAKDVMITFGGAKADLNASGTITITEDIKDMQGNSFVRLTDQPVRAGQIPVIDTAKFTGPNQVTVTFTESVTLPNTTSHFTNLRVAGESADRTVTGASLRGSGGGVVVTFGGDAVPANATGTINVSGVTDTQKNAMAPATNVEVTDGQAPTVKAMVTGPNTVTAKFSEPVTAVVGDFGKDTADDKKTLNLGTASGNGVDVRLITSFSRAAPDAFTLVFAGDPVGTDAAASSTMGFIEIATDVVDLSDNLFVRSGTIATPAPEPISDGQNPILYRAEFNEGRYFQIAYSEAASAPRGSYSALTFENGATRDLSDRSHTGDRHHINYDGSTVSSQSAMISVGSDIKDAAENAVIVPNGMIKVYKNEDPTILRAAVTAHNEITVTFNEPVKDETVNKGMFSVTVQNGGAPKAVQSYSGGNTATILLKFADNSFETGTIGTMRVNSGITDMLDKPLGAISSQNILPLQLQSITSAQLTAPNQITITFNDPVRATSANFENLSIITDGVSSGRSVTDATGSGTNTITVTFDGEPASTGATARIDIIRITGTSGESYAPLTNTQITDGQAPMLSTVTISSSNDDKARAFPGDTITLSFTASENIRQPILSINENSAVSIRSENNQWNATRTITTEDLERDSKIVQFAIDYTDTSNNMGTQVTMTTDDTMVTMTVPDATISGKVCVTIQNDDDCDASDPIYTSTPPYTMYIVPPANSGMMWEGNPYRTTTVNQETGMYVFENVTPNIEWVVQTRYFPPEHTVKDDLTSWYTRVTPTPGQEFTFDMPFYQVPQNERNTLELRTYNDINRNGMRDAGEDPIPNLTFRAYTYLSASYQDVETGTSGFVTKNDMMRGDWALLHPEDWLVSSIVYQRTDSTSGKQYMEDRPVVDDPAPGSVHTMTFGMYLP